MRIHAFHEHTITYKNKEIDFKIIKTSRKKTTEITIQFDDIFVRTPLSKSIEDIELLVSEKAEWILQKIKENAGKKPDIIQPNYKNNTTIPYLGKNWMLKIVKNEKEFVEILHDQIIIYTNKNKAKVIYEKWLFDVADTIFNQFIEKYSLLLKIHPQRILLKNLKSRWGSTTYKGTINLNINLMKAPLEVIEYVVLHEMGHLLEKNHSQNFWKIIKEHMKDYKEKIKWLKINGTNIL